VRRVKGPQQNVRLLHRSVDVGHAIQGLVGVLAGNHRDLVTALSSQGRDVCTGISGAANNSDSSHDSPPGSSLLAALVRGLNGPSETVVMASTRLGIAPQQWHDAWAGTKALAPLMPGSALFGLAFGAIIRLAGI